MIRFYSLIGVRRGKDLFVIGGRLKGSDILNEYDQMEITVSVEKIYIFGGLQSNKPFGLNSIDFLFIKAEHFS